jgi:hypothetical protein
VLAQRRQPLMMFAAVFLLFTSGVAVETGFQTALL